MSATAWYIGDHSTGCPQSLEAEHREFISRFRPLWHTHCDSCQYVGRHRA